MNIERSFIFAFKAPASTKKLLLGGVFSALFFTVFFAFVVTGYLMRILCNGLEGRDARLPDWTDLRALFNEGLQPMLIFIVYCSPLIVLSIIEIQLGMVDTFIGPYLLPVHMIVIILMSVFAPLALIRCVINGTMKSAFEFGKIKAFIKKNPGTYFTAWGLSMAVHVGANVVFLIVLAGMGGLYFIGGLSALGIGLVLGAFIYSIALFIANVITVHLYAQAYRASTPFADDREGPMRASMAVPPPLRG